MATPLQQHSAMSDTCSQSKGASKFIRTGNYGTDQRQEMLKLVINWTMHCLNSQSNIQVYNYSS